MKNRFNPSYTLCRHCNRKYIFESSPYCSIECHFWFYVNKSNGCWDWKGTLGKSGYGRFNIGKKFISAHRISFLMNNGYLTNSLNVLHKCDNPKCVNPEHLYEGTYSQNNRDMVKRDRHPAQCRPGYEGKYSAELLKEIYELKKNGFSFKKISQMKGMPFGSIYYIFKIAEAEQKGLSRKECWKKRLN